MRWCVVRIVVLWLAIVTKCNSLASEDEDVRIVRTAQGAVRGHKDPDTGVFTFYSIPYATAPVKTQKFKAPLPEPAWLHTLDAVDKGIVCPQPHSYLVKLETKLVQEDCLIANVFVPDTTDKQLPVVVYIHGGGFQLGFGDLVPPINFVKAKKFIAVTFNYRLGVHGFLCLGTDDVPGNAGMKDQLALLRWVKRNIASFGGNPEDVTIAGGSAGSVSVEILMLSKTTKGLFNKVIPESGASISPFSMQTDPIEIAKNYAKQFGFTNNTEDFYALEKFFQDSPLDMILTNVSNLKSKNSSYGFVPCVERNTGREVFLDEAPYNILLSGKYKKIPMLFGIDNMEGIFDIPEFETWKTDMDEHFSDFIPADLQFENEKEKEEVAKIIKKFYFSDKTINQDLGYITIPYVNFFTDIIFGYPTLHSVKLHVEAGHDQIYLYEYSFVDDNVPLVPYTNVRGATHCAQTIHVLDANKFMDPLAVDVTRDYNNTRDVLQNMWYSFITTGKPVAENSSLPQWPAAGAHQSPHMSIGKKVELRGPLLQRAHFWDDIYSKYYRVPEAPPNRPPKPFTEL